MLRVRRLGTSLMRPLLGFGNHQYGNGEQNDQMSKTVVAVAPSSLGFCSNGIMMTKRLHSTSSNGQDVDRVINAIRMDAENKISAASSPMEKACIWANLADSLRKAEVFGVWSALDVAKLRLAKTEAEIDEAKAEGAKEFVLYGLMQKRIFLMQEKGQEDRKVEEERKAQDRKVEEEKTAHEREAENMLEQGQVKVDQAAKLVNNVEKLEMLVSDYTDIQKGWSLKVKLDNDLVDQHKLFDASMLLAETQLKLAESRNNGTAAMEHKNTITKLKAIEEYFQISLRGLNDFVKMIETIRTTQPIKVETGDEMLFEYHHRSGIETNVVDKITKFVVNHAHDNPGRTDYPMFMCVAQCGAGKSRFGNEIPRLLLQKDPREFRLNSGSSVTVDPKSVWIDFNGGGDALLKEDSSLRPDVALGLRIVAKGVLNMRTSELREILQDVQDISGRQVNYERLFPVERVIPFFAEKRREALGLDRNAEILIILHIDEYQMAISQLAILSAGESNALIVRTNEAHEEYVVDETDLVDTLNRTASQNYVLEMIYSVAKTQAPGNYTGSAVAKGVHVATVLTGTSRVVLDFYPTRWNAFITQLDRLGLDQVSTMVKKKLEEIERNLQEKLEAAKDDKNKIIKFSQYVEKPEFQIMLEDLGRNPRFVFDLVMFIQDNLTRLQQTNPIDLMKELGHLQCSDDLVMNVLKWCKLQSELEKTGDDKVWKHEVKWEGNKVLPLNLKDKLNGFYNAFKKKRPGDFEQMETRIANTNIQKEEEVIQFSHDDIRLIEKDLLTYQMSNYAMRLLWVGDCVWNNYRSAKISKTILPFGILQLALSGIPVVANDKIDSEHTVGNMESLGLFELEEIGKTGKFRIRLPLVVLLHQLSLGHIATNIKFPWIRSFGTEWEETIIDMSMLRNNMYALSPLSPQQQLADIQPTTATFAELFPSALIPSSLKGSRLAVKTMTRAEETEHIIDSKTKEANTKAFIGDNNVFVKCYDSNFGVDAHRTYEMVGGGKILIGEQYKGTQEDSDSKLSRKDVEKWFTDVSPTMQSFCKTGESVVLLFISRRKASSLSGMKILVEEYDGEWRQDQTKPRLMVVTGDNIDEYLPGISHRAIQKQQQQHLITA